MLPSRGFFKKSDCPFFEKGLCVRPHCHFRHRKKIVSENLSNVDSRELPSDKVGDVQAVSYDETSKSYSSAPRDEDQHSKRNTEFKPNQLNSDSLFAKLVNQSNPYEKISRHIPCAYTPTPQNRGVQPKNKTLSSGISIHCASVTTKKQPVFDGYKTVKYKPDNIISSSVNETSKGIVLDTVSIEQNSTLNSNSGGSISTSTSKLVSENSHCKNSFFDKNFSDSYEPYSLAQSLCNNLGDNKTNDYVPSKVNNLTAAESKYEPNSSDLSLPCNYVPSKDKQKESEYMPEPTGNINSQITYKPSDKVLPKETQYQPGNTNCSADYIPTEKSATKSGNSSWLDNNCGSQLNEIEFISSEIEMMKAILKEEESGNKTDVSLPKTESTKIKFDNKKSHVGKHRSSKNYHSLSTKHRSKSTGDSNLSKSKHSSSSNRHTSSSSRGNSSSRNNKNDHKQSSSTSHKRKKSSHEKSKHKSHKSKSNDRSSNKSPSHKHTKEKFQFEKKIEVQAGSDESDSVVECVSDLEGNSGRDRNSESENERDLKKRKSSCVVEDRQSKMFKQDTEDLFEELEDDPDTVEKQCLEIFNSYSPGTGTDAIKKVNEVSLLKEDYENTMQGKKRTAHSLTLTSDHSVLRHKTAKTVRNSIKSAHDVMLERYKTEKAREVQTPQAPPPPAFIPGLSRPSIKIAAVSNIAQMLQAKKAIQEKLNQGAKVNERTTIAQTVVHGRSRVAHTSASKVMSERPTVSAGSKNVPTTKRQIYLDKLLLETNQIYPTKEESAEEALRLEEEVFRANLGSASAYHAAFVSLLFKTRRRVNAVKGGPSKTSMSKPTVSHFDVLSGGKKNFSILRPKKLDISMLTERHIYEELLKCKLTPEELKQNGYPMESGRPGYATCSLNFELKYNDKYTHIKRMTGNRRYCIRCSKEYEVDPISLRQYKEGPETCSYHPEKKISGGRHSDRIYRCCSSASTEGCATHTRHVTDCNNYENFPNCVKTLSKGRETNPGIFALDCEMVYTRMGYELARVTVVNLKKEIVYDTLVKPKYPIEDYNTLFSGIEEKMMEGVETTLKDVQAVLLNMFSDKTILIGHSLDSDLRALHLIHGTVVDTAVVYKNEKYHPYKYSLKQLCAKKLCKIIQDNVNGHDSAEDAIAALEIMLNHVKEEVSKYDSLESYESDRDK